MKNEGQISGNLFEHAALGLLILYKPCAQTEHHSVYIKK